jgi:hypothetical protein
MKTFRNAKIGNTIEIAIRNYELSVHKAEAQISKTD